MDLILVRHAKAFERDSAAWPDDSRRPLTAEGRRQFAQLARRLRRIAPDVDLVESSSFVRAWQTAMLLEEHARWPKPVRLERLEIVDQSDHPEHATSEAAVAADLAHLAALARTIAAMRGVGRVAWVGHEPMLSRLASHLLAGDPDRVPIDFKKGAALALRIEEGSGDAPVRARILWMLTPGLVARMRRRGR